jgi:hypothetical protein
MATLRGAFALSMNISLDSKHMSDPVYYFIRIPVRDSVLGPFDPIETLQRIQKLREEGLEYVVTGAAGVLVSEEEIKRFEG